MRVERVELGDFRNYGRAELRLAPHVSLLVGRNAQGKTNLLEAVYCLSGMGSPRGTDAVLVRDGAERALVHGVVGRGPRVVSIDLEIRPGRGTRVLVNRTPLAGAAALREMATAVFFGPDELSLVKGSPEGRRRFLDEVAVKLRPAREGLRREWERVLRQRNALLRSAPGASREVLVTLDLWDESLARAGARLTAARLDVLGRLAPHAAKRYEEIAGGGRLELAYASSWVDPGFLAEAMLGAGEVEAAPLQGMLLDALRRARSRELERGVSLVGPQRDDVSVLLQSPGGPPLEARVYASQGDQRTVALALKLAEHDMLTAALGDPPVLLLDDVFSELDPQRRAWLADAVRDMGQTLLTSAEPGAAQAARADLVVAVEGGSLEVVGGG